jgi:hypothetical protein
MQSLQQTIGNIMAKKKKNQIKFGHDALHQIICNM